MMEPSLEAITKKIRILANSCRQLGLPMIAEELEYVAQCLANRHDHADPCDDEACPCFAAGVRSEREANPNWKRP